MNNDLCFEEEKIVASAYIDSTVKLGIAQTAAVIQDGISECFAHLKCDGVTFRKYNVFWVFMKTKIKFISRPDWNSLIKVKSFPVDNRGFRTHVNTLIKDSDDRKLIIANQEVCVLDIEKHRPVKLSALPYPKEGFPKAICSDDFAKFNIDESLFEEAYEHYVRSQFIDMSHHVNNIEYIKLGLNVFSVSFLEENEIDEMEVHYLGESLEGQTLHVLKYEENTAFYIKITESERCVFEMKVSFRQKG